MSHLVGNPEDRFSHDAAHKKLEMYMQGNSDILLNSSNVTYYVQIELGRQLNMTNVWMFLSNDSLKYAKCF